MADSNLELIKKQLLAGKNIFITGSAGTGKTWTINKLSEDPRFQLSKTALTGIAALHINGDTINRFAGLGVENDKSKLRRITQNRQWEKTRERIKKASIIVIDEISMMRADTLQLLDCVFQEATKVKQPFGGKQIIFSGDFLQIPPVYRQNEKKILKRWAFQVPIWGDAKIAIHQLTQIKRQEDEVFCLVLNDIRLGNYSKEIENLFLSRQKAKKRDNFRPIKLYAKNIDIEKINLKELRELKGNLNLFNAKTRGSNSWDLKQVKKYCLAPEELFLKIGAQVMTLRNHPENKYRNGSMGVVTGYSVNNKGNKTILIQLHATGEKVAIEKESWFRTNHFGEKVAEYIQYPLKLAYAITIHKSQGMSLDCAEIDCKGIFADGQLYVALSRVRSLNGLFLKNWDRRFIRTNKDALNFYKSLK